MALTHRTVLSSLALIFLLTLGALGCGSDSSAVVDDGPFVPEAYGQWLKFEPEGAVCANGSQYKYFVNFSETSSNLVVFLEGGGACSNYEDCSKGRPFNTDCIKEPAGAECIRDNYPAVYLHLAELEPLTALTEPIGVINGDVPVELAVWTELKLHGDCHVRFEQCYYSAPFARIHLKHWVKATDNTVKIYFNRELVAAHTRLRKPGSKSTVDDHLPPEAIAYKMQDPQWCLIQAESIGENCHRLIRRLFSHKVLDNLRAAQGVIGLRKKYGDARLESACKRALFFDNPKRRTVKTILEQGLDQVPLEESTVALSSTYTRTGRFMRPGCELQTR